MAQKRMDTGVYWLKEIVANVIPAKNMLYFRGDDLKQIKDYIKMATN